MSDRALDAGLDKPAMSKYATGRDYFIALMKWCVESEPELPGEMPDEMWDALRGFAYRDDREGMIEALRITVRETKKGILERMAQCTRT